LELDGLKILHEKGGALPKQILVVDDDANIRLLLDYRLAQMGYSVMPCATGEEALQATAANQFDLIIVDLVLPGANGLELIERLRRSEGTEDTPILVLTAYSFEENRNRSQELGVAAFVRKPFSLRDLVGEIESILNAETEDPLG
jgi:DNA-binding response OmpR family regulator